MKLSNKTAKDLVETLHNIASLIFLVTSFSIAIYAAICIDIRKVGLIFLCSSIILAGCNLTIKRINQTKNETDK